MPHVRNSGRTLVLVLVALVVTAVVAWLAFGGRSAVVVESAPLAVDTQADAAPSVPTPIEVTDERERTPAATETAHDGLTTAPAKPASIAPATTSALSLRVHGIVLDLDARAVANVGVRREGSQDVLAWSGVDGSFELVLDRHGAMLLAAGDELTTVRGSLSKPGDSGELHLIVVANAVDLAGVVVDETDRPLENALVQIDVPQSAFAGFPRALDATEFVPRAARTDARGRFELARVPGSAKAQLAVALQGHAPSSMPVPTNDAKSLRIVLPRAPDGPRVVRGVVLEASLQPAVGATVRLHDATARTDTHGRFELHPNDWIPPEAPLVAGKTGVQPAIVPSFGALVAPDRLAVPEQRLVLGEPALTIRGHVVDAQDRPLPHWTVVLMDGVNMTPGNFPSTYAESLAAETNGGRATSEKDGHFEIGGLSSRTYVLRCFDMKTLVSFESAPIAAGASDVLLRVPADAVWKKVEGRVIARDGAPIANARVTLHLITDRGDSGWTSTDGAVVTSDEQGRFVLADVPHLWTYVTVDGDAVLPARHDLDEIDPTQELTLTVPRRCHFRFESSKPSDEAPQALELVDERGKGESIWLINANGWTSMTRMRLEGGKSLAISAGDGPKTLVLFRDGEPVDRIPVTLVPGDVQVIRK